jgi:hypothetical protein
LAVALAVLAAGATAILTRPLWMPASSAPLALRIEEAQNELFIRWNHNAAPVRRAQRGVLSIQDGAVRKDLELSAEEARRGGVTYARTGQEVQVRLTVFDQNGAEQDESVRYLGPPVANANTAVDTPVMETVEQLRAERDRLRQALLEQRSRATELRRTLRQIEDQLKQQ